MFKAIIFLTRKPELTHEEFVAWWYGDHAPMAAALPGVRRICFNDVATGEPVDGVSELWFDSQADFDAAYETDHGKAVAADSMAHCANRQRMFVTENWVKKD